MECQRLNKMIRAWYVQVQDETLAPARMVEFMENHVRNCDDCLMDLGIQEELKKITAIVLPASKMTKPPKSARVVDPTLPVRVFDDEDDEDGDSDDSGDDDDDDEDDDSGDDDDELDDDDDDIEVDAVVIEIDDAEIS